jgi:hypothetical protein
MPVLGNKFSPKHPPFAGRYLPGACLWLETRAAEYVLTGGIIDLPVFFLSFEYE